MTSHEIKQAFVRLRLSCAALNLDAHHLIIVGIVLDLVEQAMLDLKKVADHIEGLVE